MAKSGGGTRQVCVGGGISFTVVRLYMALAGWRGGIFFWSLEPERAGAADSVRRSN